MKSGPLRGAARHKSPLAFFCLVFGISALIWVAGGLAERFLPEEMPMDLPISSLGVFCPGVAASILVWREGGWEGVKKLLRRALDPRVKGWMWYVPVLLTMPAIAILQYGLANPRRVPIPDRGFPVWMVPVSCLVFFVAALGEEMGWQGYAIEPLQARWNALAASIVLGVVWAVWHLVPFFQLGQTPAWIAGQCAGMVVTRVLIVWLYNNTGKSVFVAVLFHAMNNVSTVLLPNYGLHYDPIVSSILIAVAAAAVTLLWGPKTLARYRYSPVGS